MEVLPRVGHSFFIYRTSNKELFQADFPVQKRAGNSGFSRATDPICGRTAWFHQIKEAKKSKTEGETCFTSKNEGGPFETLPIEALFSQGK